MSDPSLHSPDLPEVLDGLPAWWRAGGNVLRAPPGAVLPELARDVWKALPTGCEVVIASENAQLKTIRLWGHGCRVRVGARSIIHEGQINCGDGARVILADALNASWAAWIDARNGGSIEVGEDGLWSSQVRIATDDMHAIVSMDTGRRLNSRGSSIVIGRHVWLGMDSIVLPGVTIGDHAIIGIRAVVAASVPAHAVAAGVPARVIRSGVTWSHDDLPAEETVRGDEGEDKLPPPTPGWRARLAARLASAAAKALGRAPSRRGTR